MKVCKECGIEKPLDDFYRHSGMADGYLNICKRCKCSYQANRPKKKLAEIERRRNKKPDRRRHLAMNAARWRKENPDKVRRQVARYPDRRRARIAVGNAIRDGYLQRKQCEVCGDPKSHAHHEDYNRSLDVVWLCARHHRERHEERK